MHLLNVESDVSIARRILVGNTLSHNGHTIHKLSSVASDGSGVSDDDDERRGQPGPEPDRLKIDVPFAEGLRRALKKKKPKEGWPEPDEPQPDNGS